MMEMTNALFWTLFESTTEASALTEAEAAASEMTWYLLGIAVGWFARAPYGSRK